MATELGQDDDVQRSSCCCARDDHGEQYPDGYKRELSVPLDTLPDIDGERHGCREEERDDARKDPNG